MGTGRADSMHYTSLYREGDHSCDMVYIGPWMAKDMDGTAAAAACMHAKTLATGLCRVALIPGAQLTSSKGPATGPRLLASPPVVFYYSLPHSPLGSWMSFLLLDRLP